MENNDKQILKKRIGWGRKEKMGTKEKKLFREIQRNVSAWKTGSKGFGCLDRWVGHINRVNEQGKKSVKKKREKKEGEIGKSVSGN